METEDGGSMDALRIELFGLVQQIVTTGIPPRRQVDPRRRHDQRSFLNPLSAISSSAPTTIPDSSSAARIGINARAWCTVSML